ncbi:hypothetical protein E2562_018484 [Oryza meyeriana var. granulata]|uniref:Secreted protein n=1 Tax=Oryza meyeriana var. granulata TaxID=110450 RepID=A0A6G1EMM0_9ORYZ|nr:hypothetical protein E2562_018484 [Oryza meyeriana var. granulata]
MAKLLLISSLTVIVQVEVDAVDDSTAALVAAGRGIVTAAPSPRSDDDGCHAARTIRRWRRSIRRRQGRRRVARGK